MYPNNHYKKRESFQKLTEMTSLCMALKTMPLYTQVFLLCWKTSNSIKNGENKYLKRYHGAHFSMIFLNKKKTKIFSVLLDNNHRRETRILFYGVV